MVFAAGAFIVRARRRIGAEQQETMAGGQALMPRAGRQSGDVTGLQLQGPSAASTKLHLPLTAGEAAHLMGEGMVVHIVVDAITPRISPAVDLKQLFEHGRRIELLRKSDCPMINDQ